MKYDATAKRPNFLFPKGEYSAKILEADERLSKAGNPMLVVKLEVYNNEQTKFINDYIVIGGEHAQDWKLGHLVKSCGLPTDGEVHPAALLDRYIRTKVKVKPASGDYREDNAIEDYLEKQAGDLTQAETAKSGSNLPPAVKAAISGGASDNEPPYTRHEDRSW